ncbi:MAG: TonB-dependent receptor [Tannerella sp.]|jgi:TonB-linked SusC/RagA family outer membrane protein|nr:TonB-dependent receptor [Tannerella sp.]
MKFFNTSGFIAGKIRFLRIMKATFLLLFLFTGVCFGAKSYSQETTFSLNMKNETAGNVIRYIEENSEFIFFYMNDNFDANRKVSVHVKDRTIEDILEQLLKGTDNTYKISDRQITIMKKEKDPITDPVVQQPSTRKITGTVKETTGEPIIGANVVEKGTTNGISTDADGNFSLNIKENAVLLISYIGYIPQEIPVQNQRHIAITLIEDSQKLEEVIVVGYGTMRKSDITGAVSSVKPEELRRIPSPRTDEALQGQVAGVQIINNDASPNANISVRIRGVNSITATSQPLVIIDGMQGGNLADVHPNDIESLEVLKDASSTAIYGSRGSGGVILVTTKRGGTKKPAVSYSGFYTLQRLAKKMDLMNGEEYANYINENRLARGLAPVFTGEAGASPAPEYYKNNSTDWQDEIFRTGYTQNHHLNIDGLSDNISYNIAGDYTETQGIVINSRYRKYSARSKLSIDLLQNVKLNFNSFFDSVKDNPTQLDRRGEYGSPVYAALNYAPTRPVYEEDGSYSLPGGGYGSNTEYNPVALAREPVNLYTWNTVTLNPELEIKILKKLKFQPCLFYQINDGENDWYYNEKITGTDDNSIRTAYIIDYRWTTIQNTKMLNYEDNFAEKHRIGITAVAEQQYIKYTNNYAAASGFNSNEKSYKNLGLGKNALSPSSYEYNRTLLSFMGRVSYTYSDRYSLIMTMRGDGSSVFAKNNKWGYFPSAGIAWNISNEQFMEKIEILDNLKLRLSYGAVGNQAISPYQSLDLLTTGSAASYSFDGGNSLTPGVMLSKAAGNPNLKWETTTQLNTGVDLSLFKGRFTLTADIYNKTTKDLLFQRQLYLASGQSTQVVNAGKIRNRGVELAVGGTPVQNRKFDWITSFTFASNRSKVLSLNDGMTEFSLGNPGMRGYDDAICLEVGQPIGLVKGFRYESVWKSNEQEEAAAYGLEPGSPRYYDADGNKVIDTNDMVTIAKTLPDFTYSWSNNLRVGNISIGVLLVGVQGNDIINLGRYMTEGDHDGLSRNLLRRWTPENENTNVPGHKILGAQSNSSQWVENGSYLRVKNVTIGYRVPEKFLSRFGIRLLRLYATGTNLFTFTSYSGYDPEANNAPHYAIGDTGAFSGFDMGGYPSQRRYTFGLDITF